MHAAEVIEKSPTGHCAQVRIPVKRIKLTKKARMSPDNGQLIGLQINP